MSVKESPAHVCETGWRRHLVDTTLLFAPQHQPIIPVAHTLRDSFSVDRTATPLSITGMMR